MSAGRRRDTATLAVARVFVCELRLTHSGHLVVTGKIRIRRGWTAWFNQWWVFLCVNLCPADSDDPGGRDDDSSVCSQRAALLNLLQHEACHLVVILKHKLKSENTALCMDHSLTIKVLFASMWCEHHRSNWTVNTVVTTHDCRTYCLFAPWAADGNNLFAVKWKLLLKSLLGIRDLFTALHQLSHTALTDWLTLTFPHCRHFPVWRLLWTQWCRTTLD